MKKQYVIKIDLKEAIADPQGRTVQDALGSMGFVGENTRVGKTVSFITNASRSDVEAVCREFLVNPVMEDYEIIREENVE